MNLLKIIADLFKTDEPEINSNPVTYKVDYVVEPEPEMKSTEEEPEKILTEVLDKVQEVEQKVEEKMKWTDICDKVCDYIKSKGYYKDYSGKCIKIKIVTYGFEFGRNSHPIIINGTKTCCVYDDKSVEENIDNINPAINFITEEEYLEYMKKEDEEFGAVVVWSRHVAESYRYPGQLTYFTIKGKYIDRDDNKRLVVEWADVGDTECPYWDDFKKNFNYVKSSDPEDLTRCIGVKSPYGIAIN